MTLTKKNVYSFIGEKCTVKYSKGIFVIVGLNRKGRLLILPAGETDGILNRIAVYISNVKLLKDESL